LHLVFLEVNALHGCPVVDHFELVEDAKIERLAVYQFELEFEPVVEVEVGLVMGVAVGLVVGLGIEVELVIEVAVEVEVVKVQSLRLKKSKKHLVHLDLQLEGHYIQARLPFRMLEHFQEQKLPEEHVIVKSLESVVVVAALEFAIGSMRKLLRHPYLLLRRESCYHLWLMESDVGEFVVVHELDFGQH